MELRNHTPFAPLLFESRDPRDRSVGVLALRATFGLVDGAPLRPLPDQSPPLETDRYHGDPAASSVRAESDVLPFKPRTDLVFDAVAHAPDGIAARDWLVRVRVAPSDVVPAAHLGSLPAGGDGAAERPRPRAELPWALEKYLRVTGPRVWQVGRLGWRPGEAEPCTQVPLRYERAYGGSLHVDGADVAYRANPVGTGYVLPRLGKPPAPVAMPQIEDPFDPVVTAGHPYPPQGLGPIGRSWAPRLALAGTYDAAWHRDRAPRPPLDFDYAFYNGAHPDLRWNGFMEGSEVVSLVGLHARGEVRVQLPGYRCVAVVRRESGAIEPVPMLLDTVHFDLTNEAIANQRAALVWRASFGMDDAPRVVEVRMASPFEPAESPNDAAAPGREPQLTLSHSHGR